MDNCIFCKIISNEGFSPIYETEQVVVLMSLENHPLVIPRKHFKDIYELEESVGAEIMQVAIRVAKALKSTLNCDGVNLIQSNEIAAGQEVFHFHLHVKPRWENDSTHLHWDTAVVAQDIRDQTAAKLKAGLSGN